MYFTNLIDTFKVLNLILKRSHCQVLVLTHQNATIYQRNLNLNGCNFLNFDDAFSIGKSPRRTLNVDKSIPGPG